VERSGRACPSISAGTLSISSITAPRHQERFHGRMPGRGVIEVRNDDGDSKERRASAFGRLSFGSRLEAMSAFTASAT